MAFKTMIIDGDTNEILEVRELRSYDVSQVTFDKFESEFGKPVVFAASNAVYGKGYNIFVLESKK